MKKAKYYIYRNLTKDCFSIRYKGKVIGHYKSLIAFADDNKVQYKVNHKGRARVLAEKKKYVHAFIVCDSFQTMDGYAKDKVRVNFEYACNHENGFKQAYYNPFLCSNFVNNKTGMPVHETSFAILINNKVYF